MGATALVIAAVGAAVVGAGVSAYGQYQQGQTQNALAQFNAKQQESQARAQATSMQVQAALKQREAETNFKLRTAESQARLNNAHSIELQALAQDNVNRENLGKRREDFSRMQATQRAMIAESGVVESSGTPLDLLAETAGKIQSDMEENHYTGEVQRRTLFSEAAQERLGGKLALAGATLDRDSSLAAAALTNASAKGEYLAGLRGSEISRLTGGAAAKAGMYSAVGTLFSGLSSAAGTGATYRRS
jgi:hypothetical protein